MPSTSLIALTSDMIFDLNGRKGKTITRLIDGDLLTKIDASGTNEDAFVLPYRSMIVLPNIYGNMKFEVWESFGSGGTFTVRLYNAAKILLGTYSKAKSAFNSWQVNNPATVSSAPLNGLTMEQHTTVRFIEIYLPLAADLNIGDFELRLYGDITGAAASIYPGTAIGSRTDPGRYGHGINIIDDRIQEYLQGSPSTYLSPLMAGSLRVGHDGARFNIYPESYEDPLIESPIDLGRYGNDNLKTRAFNFTLPRDIQIQMYHGGGSLKNLTLEQAQVSNGEYVPNIAPVNDFKYLEIGADATQLSSWDAKAKLIAGLAGLYGTNASADMTGITVTNGSSTVGQGGMNEIEVGNEINRDWAGATPYHTPLEYYITLKACYDEVKARGSDALVMAPAVTFMDVTYWRAVYFWHFWLYGVTPFPMDGANMNLYLNSDLDGQGQSGGSTGLNPEAWGLNTRLASLNTLWDLIFPNTDLHLSEYGFASFAGSPYDVVAIGSKTSAQVSGDIALRTEAIFQLYPFVRKTFYYAFFEDGTGSFNSMAATTYAHFTPGYNGNTVYPVGYCLTNKFFVEKDYNYHSTLITNGGTVSAWITVKNHPTDPLKKLFKVWRGTMNGSTGLVAVPVGANAVSATLYTLNYSSLTPNSAAALISGTNINVTATEGMQWLEVTYETPGNVDPVADAGTDQTIQLPTSQVTVNGSGSSDADGTITTYAWTKISGPATFTITSPSSVSTTITGLVEGTYVFRLTVTDNDGGTDTDDITITVQPANIAPTAAAGSDQSITLPTDNVSVNGSSSSDPDGTITTYLWTKISGPVTYTITSPGSASTTITGLIAGVYVFRLTVTDNDGATDDDDIQITVNEEPGNASPIAVAGSDQAITLPINFVTVNGTASNDPDGTITDYLWQNISGPATYTITSPTTAITTITGLVAGTYVFRLTVTDNDDAIGSDLITITVNPDPAAPTNRRRWFRGAWFRNIFRRG
jgi:hypothetical protein